MTEPVVDIRKLWTVFPNGDRQTVVHKDLDLTVERGEVLSLVGGSGTGKTVLLRQILGLETPTKGEITVLGKPAAELGKRGAASRVGMLFQQGALFSAFTVVENIAFPLRELKTLPDALILEAAMVKLQMVGLGPEVAERMPSDLSGGMIKRVALARALIMHKGMELTVVMVTHDLDTLFELSTRIAVLAEQKVIINDVPREVVAFPHPFIHEFFLGERGQRAMALLREYPFTV
jgi:phospholipid/cholesterol/gamma-HCH transport system ATP-binding protein